MNILLVNQYAGSLQHGMEYRPFYLGREWSRAGHQVTVVAGSQSHVRERDPGMEGSIAEEVIGGVRYLWLRTLAYTGNGFRRAANIFSFVAQLFRYRQYIASAVRPDVVIASSTHPLDIYPACRIAQACQAQLVFEVHDLWPLSPMELGGLPWWHPFILLLQCGEDFACRHANWVVSILPLAHRHLCCRGMAIEKYFHVPNGIDVTEWDRGTVPLPDLHQREIASRRERGQFLVGYAGAFGAANALQTLIRASERLQREPVTVVLIGRGPDLEKLEHLVRARQLANTVLLPPLPKESVPSFLVAMDALYLGAPRQPLYRFGVSPNKLFDYMMAGRPIIQAIEAGNDLVAEADCGISCAPENPDAVAEAVRDLLHRDPQERASMGLRGRNYVLRHHDYRVLAKKFLEVLL